MNDVSCWEVVSLCNLCLAGWAAAELAAFSDEVLSSGAVDGAVYSASSEERCVGGIDDGIDLELGDVPSGKTDTVVGGGLGCELRS